MDEHRPRTIWRQGAPSARSAGCWGVGVSNVKRNGDFAKKYGKWSGIGNLWDFLKYVFDMFCTFQQQVRWFHLPKLMVLSTKRGVTCNDAQEINLELGSFHPTEIRILANERWEGHLPRIGCLTCQEWNTNMGIQSSTSSCSNFRREMPKTRSSKAQFLVRTIQLGVNHFSWFCHLYGKIITSFWHFFFPELFLYMFRSF